MSMECGECERDLRGGHAKSCSRWRPCVCPVCLADLEDGDGDLWCKQHGSVEPLENLIAFKRIGALTAEVGELISNNIALSKIVTPSASHPVISRFCGLSVAEILSLTARAEAAEAKLAQGVRVKPGHRVDAYDLTMGGKTVPLDRAIDAVPVAQIEAAALERAAEYVEQNSLSWRFSSPWGGKDFAKEIRALKGTMK